MTSTEKTPTRVFGTRLEGIDYVDRPGAYAVIENNDGQIAVIETTVGYFLPGGGMEAGETELEALKREIREEIGYQALLLAEIGETVEYIEDRGQENYYQIRSRFYRVQLGPKIGEGIEQGHRLVWVSCGEAIKLLTRQGQAWAVQAKDTR
jgi:8-oxo-dGTP diphosphatase